MAVDSRRRPPLVHYNRKGGQTGRPFRISQPEIRPGEGSPQLLRESKASAHQQALPPKS